MNLLFQTVKFSLFINAWLVFEKSVCSMDDFIL
jgi:hypothetical protein